MTQEELLHWLQANDYTHLRVLEDGSIAGIVRLAFTVGLCVGLGPVEWQRRYCYETLRGALDALHELRSVNDEPTGWIARRPETAEDVERKRRPPLDAT